MSLKSNFSLKTSALLAVGLSVPACVFATVPNPGFNGYYGGLGAGVMRTESKISTSATSSYENYYDDNNQLALSQSGVEVHKYTGTGALYVGFGHFINNSDFYLAGEIFANWAHRKNTLDNWAYHQSPDDDEDFESLSTATSVQLNNGEMGIDIRPGYLIDTNTMVYARLGLAFNKVKTTTGSTFSFTDMRSSPFSVYNSSLNQSNRHSKTGARIGIGLEHMVSDRLAVTADYIYTYYGKSNTTGVGNTTTIVNGGEDGPETVQFINIDGLEAKSSGRISTQSAMLGIKYYFMPVC